MTLALSGTETATFKVLGNFLVGILPSDTEILQTQNNRVPEPKAANFVNMTPLRRGRLATNVDQTADCRFTGSIAGTTLTVTDVQIGQIQIGATVFGVGVTTATLVTAFGSGSGQNGTYTVSKSQTVTARTLSAGQKTMMQSTELPIQLDVYGPNSADNAQVISTAMRDEFATESFAALAASFGVEVYPLHADDPRQMPFVNDQNQYQRRWIVEALLQVKPVVSVPQQYADNVDLGVLEVDATYPPT